jgi:hypothetical protein
MTSAPKTVRNGESEEDWNVRAGDYVVVQIGHEWHILFQPHELPHHYLSIARFQDRNRAEQYADIESDSVNDGAWQQNVDTLRLKKIAGGKDEIKVHNVDIPEDERPEDLQPLTHIEEAILADLSDFRREHPSGATLKQLAARHGEGEQHILYSVKELVARGFVEFDGKVMKAPAPPAPSPPAAVSPPPLPETAPELEAPPAPPAGPAIPIQEPDIKPSEGQAPAETSAISPPPGGDVLEEANKPAPAAIARGILTSEIDNKMHDGAALLSAGLNLGRGETIVLDALEQARGKVVTCSSLCDLTGCSKGSVEAYISNLKRRLKSCALTIDGYPTAGWRLMRSSDVTAQLMGDPAPQRSALASRGMTA